MTTLLRSSITRRAIRSALLATSVGGASTSSSSTAIASSSSRTFTVCAPRSIADNQNDAAPARSHRPRSSVGPGSPAQTSSPLHSKDENLGVVPPSQQQSVDQTQFMSKTQRDAISSAVGVLDTLARDVSGSTAPPTSFAQYTSPPTSTPSGSSSTSSISTPSTPNLTPIYDSSSGPIYTTTSLPPRADPTLEFLTNLLMKDGKKAQAQRFTTRTLSIIATNTNSNPLPLIEDAITRCAPLVKLQSKKQGGKTLQVPVALTARQSTRKALTWIIEASKKRPDREIEKRLAAEFLAVVEGTSNAIQKKEEQHRMATVNRANAAVRI